MRTGVFDLEADGLLHQATRIWVVVLRILETGERHIFCDHPADFPDDSEVHSLQSVPAIFDSLDAVVAHNGIAYDLPVFQKILGYRVPRSVTRYDTLLMSQVLDWKRFGFGHSLARWGEHLGYRKQEHEEWDRWSQAMLTRCMSDVEINVLVYRQLMKELREHRHRDRIVIGLRDEHDYAEFCARASLYGFPFDMDKATRLQERLESMISEIEAWLQPEMRPIIAPMDSRSEHKSPRWVKNGHYAKNTWSWFGIEPESGLEERPIWGDYCRVHQVETDCGSIDSIKLYLYRLGWVPDEWNYRREGRELIRTSPKLSASSLARLGWRGVQIDRLLTMRSRLNVLRGWMEAVTPEGRLHGDILTIGAETARSTHKVIANIPKGDTETFISKDGRWEKVKEKPDMTDPLPWLPDEVGPEGTRIYVAERAFGPQVRELFTAAPGYRMVGADSSGNQFRALCHYLGPGAAEYTKIGIEGDIHTFHAGILSEVVPGVNRGTAKPWFYGYIFGSGDAKSGLILTGKSDREIGRRAKDKFASRIPGFADLQERLERLYTITKKRGQGYIVAIDGRRIYVDSKHKLLNYLLQSCEKVTCMAAVADTMNYLDENGFDWQPCIAYHDEMQFMVREDQAEAACEFATRAYAEAPKRYGITIMDGDGKIGDNWKDCH